MLAVRRLQTARQLCRCAAAAPSFHTGPQLRFASGLMAQVKQLRDQSGAPLTKCKKALEDTQGDLEAAFTILREQGATTAAKLGSRTTSEGLVSLAVRADNRAAAAIELQCETDFVSRTADFRSLARDLAELAVPQDAAAATAAFSEAAAAAAPEGAEQAAALDLSAESQTKLTDAVAKLRENIQLTARAGLTVENGIVVGYVHSTEANAEGCGSRAALVALETASTHECVRELGQQLALHVAASEPAFLSEATIAAEALAAERTVFETRAQASGKPAAVMDKIVGGMVNKWLGEHALLQQPFALDESGKLKVAQLVKQSEKEAGSPIQVRGFVLLKAGEKPICDMAP